MQSVVRRHLNDALHSAGEPERIAASDALWNFAERRYRPSIPYGEPDYYERRIPEDLLFIDLTEQEWRDFRQEVLDIIQTVDDPEVQSRLIMAITTAPPWDAVDTVVPLLHDHREEYPPDQVASLLISLDKVLDIFPRPGRREQRQDEERTRQLDHVKDVVRKFEVPKMLDELAVADDWRVSQQAQEVRQRLNSSIGS